MSFSGFGSTSNQSFTFDFRVANSIAGSSSTKGTSPVSDLCTDCSALDLEQSFEKGHRLYEESRRGLNTRKLVTSRSKDGPSYLRDFYFVTSLGHRLSESRNCKLCELFKHHADDPQRGTYKLLVICSSETTQFEAPRKNGKGKWIMRPWDDLEYNVLLAVVPEVAGIPRTGIPLHWLETGLPQTGSIYRLTKWSRGDEIKRILLPAELAPQADLLQAWYWYQTCMNAHGICCAPKKPPGASLPGFRAINCLTDSFEIENISWSEKYVALSYVWGTGTENERWPATVKDAIAVTKKMKLKYLWVDRVCINQDDYEEKMFLVSKMDAIYEGAEFTIVNAAGNARTGLPGVSQTIRKPQHRVELNLSKGKGPDTRTNSSKDLYLDLLNVPEAEYHAETKDHTVWLDTHRFGISNVMTFDMDEMLHLADSKDRASKYGISKNDLEFHEKNAESFGMSFETYMETSTELARRIGITFPELVPYLKRQAAGDAGIPDNEPLPEIDMTEYVTNPKKPLLPLPPGITNGKTVLVSTMQEPRLAIRKSEWATRGWTYQEGVLSNRCLVFTLDQMYWECRGMAVHESVRLPLPKLHVKSKSKEYWHLADYMLSGIFGGDMHKLPQLQYGFQADNSEEGRTSVASLLGHIRGFTSRKLKGDGDSWNAFLGIHARFSDPNWLNMILGIPFLAGPFANGQNALQHTFALSLSIWFHIGKPFERGSELFISDCHRRTQFPSWSWVGWEGKVDFNGDNNDWDIENHEDDDVTEDNFFVEFYSAMLSSEWVSAINRIWSTELVLSSTDGSYSTILSGPVPLEEFGDQRRTWTLTIKDALVLRHLHLMHSPHDWRCLMGMPVSIHLSTPYTEDELKEGHKSGEIVVVLLFASVVPYVWDGRARFLILKRTQGEKVVFERIGTLTLILEEWMMHKYNCTDDMIRGLPVKKYGGDIDLM
ncbi:hypothetical protein VTL71DRAFT_24 [Oculimacula yallundae]|uniref:Heterokaryon incompatibility domain-containing protein n=1 Tax=Oculimacula yallundae TaxID=86028 RepID=A0ABR4CYY5_9HELO